MLVNLEERRDWTPLIMTIVTVILIGTSLTLMVYWRGYGGAQSIELYKAGIILAMLTIVALLVSLILLLYDKMRASRTLLTVGLLLLMISVVLWGLNLVW